jgi:hypothetical protein
LPAHLAAAGWGADLRALLLSVAWIERKLAACGVTALLRDYDFAADDATAAVGRALQLSAYVLRLDAALLRGQLAGRLSASAVRSVDLATMLDQAVRGGTDSWLCPARSVLGGPDGGLAATLGGHAGDVTGVAVSLDFRWVLSGSHDRCLRLWCAPRGDSVGIFAAMS